MRRPWRFGGQWWERINAPLVAAIVATGLSVGLFAGHRAGWWELPGLEAAEQASIDARFRLRGREQVRDDRIVIIGLDEKTRTEQPELIQTRRGWATLIDRLAAARPAVIGIDAFFANPEINLSAATTERVRQAAAGLAAEVDLSAAAVAAREALSAVVEETRGDEILAAAVARARNVTLGFAFVLDDAASAAPLDEPVGLLPARYGEAVSVAAPVSRRPIRAEFVTVSMPSIAQGATGAGFLNMVRDDDGNTRRAPLVIERGGRFYLPFAMSIAAIAEGGAFASYAVGDDAIRFGDHLLPVDRRGQAWVSYLGPGATFPHVSAGDVVAGRIEPGRLRGKLLLVGYTDLYRDTLATPFDPQLPGVEYHATLIHNLLRGELLSRAGSWTTLATLVLLGAAMCILQIQRLRRRRAWVVGVGAIVLIAGYLVAAQLAFTSRHLIVDVVAPLSGCLLIALASLTVGLATEGREKARIRSVFSQYVQDTVVERMLENPKRAAVLGGVRRELTVLFSDIRGFSLISEKLEPEVLSEYLNQYFTPMTRLIMERDGLLDKYIGDAVMAVYGAPLEQTDHACRACATALAMLAALEPLNDGWRRQGLVSNVAIGVGINSGPMSVGNMGSEARFDYTVLGDAVNLAARLESLTREYEVDVLVGERTAELAGGEFAFRELDTVRVKGRTGTARIFELVGPHDRPRFSSEELAAYREALAAYRAGEWDEARAAFSKFCEGHPADGPSQVMLTRLESLVARPRGAWDGVFDQLSK